ncbi:fused MFS/spermidine synthase [Glutamicibacter sp. PS]|uniref:spermidine synthase n=1 Tax=Glutamicibacter sp. PS TaxID=3075634 RepID=UPI00285078EB|nr:fused MFS/spermidine synthase [Glutamicibacter sp. PS]MDR4532990.1 fused MFS/spermidine synthase [Glutamicibacter sp. PS]
MSVSPPKRWLSFVQKHATIEEDTYVEGARILSIGGAEQSHVNLRHPEEVFYEYLARIANQIRVLRGQRSGLKFLHLGAGALTLARWASVSLSDSTHVVVDIERELVDFVMRYMPLPAGTAVHSITADAREVLHEHLASEKFDVIIVDIFSGPEAPEHLTVPEYYRELGQSLTPDGLLFVNIGDDPPLRFTDRQVAAARSTFDFVMLSSTPDMFTRRYPGNLVLMGTNTIPAPELIELCEQSGPFPSEIRHSVSLDRFGKP